MASSSTTSTDALSRVTTTAYDAAGRVTVVTDPLSHTVATAYDAASGRIFVTGKMWKRLFEITVKPV